MQTAQPDEDEGYVIEDDNFGEEGSADNLHFDQDTEKENYWVGGSTSTFPSNALGDLHDF